MGLGTKLNCAFIMVILVVVLTQAAYTLFAEYQITRGEAHKRLASALDLIKRDLNHIAQSNLYLGRALQSEPALNEALASQSREGIARFFKDILARSGFPGFLTIVDGQGKVFYSTDTPAKSGHFIRNDPAVAFALKRSQTYVGAASFSPTGLITISAMLPVRLGRSAEALLIVSQSLSTEFLTGLATKMELLPDRIAGVDLALFSARDKKIVAVTQGLINKDDGFLNRVNDRGIDFKSDVEKGFPLGACRLWKPFVMVQPIQPAAAIAGTILLTATIPSLMPKLALVSGQATVSVLIALALSFFFATAISGSVSQPLRFLIQRGRDLASGKIALSSLEGLSGPWLELGELMDTSVATMRASIQSLKAQLSTIDEEIQEKLAASETANQQLDTVNKQLADKNRQLAEVSKQVNFANQQVLLLQQKLDSVLQISTEGFLFLDQYGSVLHANPVFLNWMGVTEGEIAGRFCFDLVKKPGQPRDGTAHDLAVSRHHTNPADLIAQFYPEGVVWHRYQDKSVAVLAHLQPIVTENINIQGYILVLRDKSLRSEIAQLRNEIVSVLSDSIRAPLISLEPTWKAVLDSAPQNMQMHAAQTLVELHTHYQQLLSLVDSLLMMYGGIIPPPVVPHEPVLMTRLVADCLEEVALKAREHQLMLDYKTVTGLPPVNVDRETIKRAIVQILEKMIEITAPGGRVRVETLLKGHDMRVGFYSSGPALPPSEIEDMFAGFIDGKHSEDTYGSRLAMYLARNNIERLGGRVWAECHEGRGTAAFFTVTAG